MQHYNVTFQPDNITVTIHHGATLLEAAGLAGIILSTPCGGIGRCGKCRVQLLPSKKDVLACQYTVEHDVEAAIPDASRFYKQQILEHGISRDVDSAPSVRKVCITDGAADVQDLCGRLSEILGAACTLATDAAAGLPGKLDACTGVVRRAPDADAWHLTDVEAGDTTAVHFGLAVDIGTTSVVARLVNQHTGDSTVTASAANPQARYGADVISRIGFADTDDGANALQRCIVTCLNDLTAQAARQAGIDPAAIYEITVAGNTTMNHLLLKYPVHQLGQSPYAAHSVAAVNLAPAALGLTLNPAGNVHILPNIAGFVGADTVAAALACGMNACTVPTLLVDIGTNGELVLAVDGRLLAASCAAGPALEGAGIEFGSRAQDGAIERVVRNDTDIDVDVIGRIPAATLCGSGLIDAVAVMLDLGILDETGRFAAADERDPFMPGPIVRRLVTRHDQPAFVLSGRFEGGAWQDAVVLTQKDIRQLQLAKAAIGAGIALLLKNGGRTASQIGQILLAGAFGNYIQKESAVRIGLLPPVGLEKIHFVGNAAGSGARMALVSESARKLAATLAAEMEYLEIAHQTEFQMVFSECLLFPPG